ncbi:MAG: proteasome accessory factor PafA2 family protein, partial [Nitrospiria bacterium]
DLDESDPVIESMELVRACLTKPFRQEWDYSMEDPRQDARGFRADQLAQDEEEKAFEKSDRNRPFSFHEMKSDLALTNGARFYNDHTHPEYSTPECRSLKDLIIHDKAGERIVQECANRRNALLENSAVQLYKNNTDFHGHSYGCHDNYLLPRSIPFEKIIQGLTPFLVTRQIIAGAGKMGIETPNGFQPGHFQLSQRADFIEVEMSVDTMTRRPIINTRDEPHADRLQFRRLHQILGDSNLSEISTALKVGTTWLALRLIEQNAAPKEGNIPEPVRAVHEVSLDTTCKNTIKGFNGKTISPIDHQRLYLEAAKKSFGQEDDPDTRWTLKTWEEVLNDLEFNPERLINRLDWVAKKWLLQTYMDEEGVDWKNPSLIGIDLEYHNINPDRGLFLAMEMAGHMERLSTDNEIKEAISVPPSDTRAAIRGLCIDRFHSQIDSVQWERIVFKKGLFKKELDLKTLFEPADIVSLKNRLSELSDVTHFFS